MSIAQQIDTPYQVITDRILTLLEQGTVPWQQPWDQHDGAAAQPLQPAALSRHQRLAVDGDGLRVPVLGARSTR